MTNIIIQAYNAIGGPNADYRIQGATMAILIAAGIITAVIIKKRKTK
jgi:hypothetical protein